ncbi:protein winged eye isoform X2 [Cylas formicarius]|uniref:protein winged eye isoform X2 n=1 Tax=Cylas formicarius TaxID=197179 RepID=UPI0029584F44|nr:protein winged eye isoform X2 [Cylas formicarius]
MIGSPAGPGGPSQRGLWPLAAAPAPTATSFSTEGLSKYGVYSLFPGGPTFGSALYSHASTIGRFASGHIQQSSGNAFHAAHKVSDSLFSATGYTFGAPTPPPGSPYSPIPVAQLELLAKGFTNSNIIIQQPADFPPSPKKLQQIAEKRCDEKCCSLQRPTKICHCGASPIKKIHELNGCSRTNPIEWNGVNVKKEPGVNPCQVAEITTSVSPIVKVEVASPIQKNCDQNAIIGNAFISNTRHIPVGIAARQRVQQELIASPSLPPVGLLATVNAGGGAQIKEISRITEIDNIGTMASMAANASGTGPQGGTLLQCTDDRSTALAAWQVGGNQSQAVATPTLWQYPAPVPVEPMVPLPVPSMPPVGFQLVRDPTTGGLLLLPTTGIAEPVQQTVVWPSYPQPSSVLLPSISSLPPPPLQLLSSASSDYLSSSTTLHQHTQTHSTRLVAVTTDTKRKLPMQVPTTTLIKIETDGTLDQTKTLQAVSTIGNSSGTMFADPALVTTHVIYQHPTNLLLSQTPNSAETACRSQATSPVTACLTPPPDTVQLQTEEQITLTSAVQDASNQTDTPLCSEDDNTTQTIAEELPEDKAKSEVETKPEQENPETSINEATDRHRELVHPEPGSTSASLPEEATILEEQKEEEEEVDAENSAGQSQPDLSGLELLSNSIVEFEICRNSVEDNVCKPEVTGNEQNTSEASGEDTLPMEEAEPKKVEDNFGGLDLLCALAEQRIREESIVNPSKERTKDRDKERKREKRKSKKHSLDEPKRKKVKSEKRHCSDDRERQRRKKEKRISSDRSDSEKQERELCLCKFKSYKTPESEQEVRKFLASKSQSTFCCNREWPCMNAMELDMRIRLADLQRQYREKQKELSKLKTRKHSHSSDCPKKKSRKKSTHSDRSTPPPQLDKMDVPVNPISDLPDLLKPPKLCAMTRLDNYAQSDCDSSPEKHSSSKKRKVGRPKKLTSSDGEQVTTETIVAKKPKNNFVEYLLAAKEKLKQQNKEYPDATPPRYVEETYTHKLKKIKNNNTITMNDIKSSKIRPKLKAEPTLKTYFDDDNNEYESELEEEEVVDEEAIGDGEEMTEHNIEDEEDSGIQEEQETVENYRTEEEEKVAPEKAEEVPVVPNPCTLTEDRLGVDKLRVLTAMGGLFYAGHLNAVEPPDVYSITLDGERGNRPHIMSREEILRDAIVEISPKSTEDLPVGTRLCAYWSQQYRCLYPGSAAEPGTPDPHLDGKFVSVEFDDGDSGRIALEDIRLLPPNYPIMEYDPNPLLSLCKRRRRTSTSVSTEEKRIQPTDSIRPQVQKSETVKPVMEETKSDVEKLHKEKKRLKKKKRDKLKQKTLGDEKKKRRKHKCVDEHCKHKKHHKKHKKHKKRHEKNKLEPETMHSHLTTIIEEQNEEDVNSEEVEENRDIGNAADDDESSKQDSLDDFPAYEIVANPEDEVTMDDILEATKNKKSKKIRDRQESCESRSKMSAFLPARQLWHWSGKGYKRPRAKGKSKKCFYKAIQRGKESITVGDSAVFLSTGRPDRPYIGRIEAMWELCGTMVVKVKWFYHPEETVGCPTNLQYPGALFESPHVDENDVQTISHKCEVLPLNEYTERLGDDPRRYASIYDNNDIYYLAGYYDPTSNLLKMEPGIPFTKGD